MPYACETEAGIFGIGMTTREARDDASYGTGANCLEWRVASMTAGAFAHVQRHGYDVTRGDPALVRDNNGWRLASERAQ